MGQGLVIGSEVERIIFQRPGLSFHFVTRIYSVTSAAVALLTREESENDFTL
jgi:hypothetical protein